MTWKREATKRKSCLGQTLFAFKIHLCWSRYRCKGHLALQRPFVTLSKMGAYPLYYSTENGQELNLDCLLNQLEPFDYGVLQQQSGSQLQLEDQLENYSSPTQTEEDLFRSFNSNFQTDSNPELFEGSLTSEPLDITENKPFVEQASTEQYHAYLDTRSTHPLDHYQLETQHQEFQLIAEDVASSSIGQGYPRFQNAGLEGQGQGPHMASLPSSSAISTDEELLRQESFHLAMSVSNDFQVQQSVDSSMTFSNEFLVDKAPYDPKVNPSRRAKQVVSVASSSRNVAFDVYDASYDAFRNGSTLNYAPNISLVRNHIVQKAITARSQPKTQLLPGPSFHPASASQQQCAPAMFLQLTTPRPIVWGCAPTGLPVPFTAPVAGGSNLSQCQFDPLAPIQPYQGGPVRTTPRRPRQAGYGNSRQFNGNGHSYKVQDTEVHHLRAAELDANGQAEIECRWTLDRTKICSAKMKAKEMREHVKEHLPTGYQGGCKWESCPSKVIGQNNVTKHYLSQHLLLTSAICPECNLRQPAGHGAKLKRHIELCKRNKQH
ncbi:hypothetical protein C8J56DRAFT_953012 [Mycena floridula]|nr:hypothetical protein C8J56DRAFT_953012 [Mycena floridula]